ncbi:hypothetical protein HZC30_08025 [Candidatus Woesearchaeota archaeon]|nr:hypothetical protein [Candidatus Woesearchaeota archaeon]
MEIKNLLQLGFTENEAKVYLALLEAGLSTITKIISKTNLHKQIIYDNLQRLTAKGLVSYVIQSNRKYFQAVSPEKIKDILEEQKKELESKENLLKEILPQLLARKEESKPQSLATIYYGKKGLKSILEEILTQKEEVLSFGAEGKFRQIFGPYWENYNRRREKLKVKIKVIWNEKLKGKRENLLYLDAKYIPKEFDNPASTMIYGDKTAIILWEEIPFAVLIESAKIARSYRNTFELLWKASRK